jgi:hypothetical protein
LQYNFYFTTMFSSQLAFFLDSTLTRACPLRKVRAP